MSLSGSLACAVELFLDHGMCTCPLDKEASMLMSSLSIYLTN